MADVLSFETWIQTWTQQFDMVWYNAPEGSTMEYRYDLAVEAAWEAAPWIPQFVAEQQYCSSFFVMLHEEGYNLARWLGQSDEEACHYAWEVAWDVGIANYHVPRYDTPLYRSPPSSS